MPSPQISFRFAYTLNASILRLRSFFFLLERIELEVLWFILFFPHPFSRVEDL